MLGQRQQQQVEERQRHAHQRVLHRVHRQAFQHFEEEETGEGQDNKQQRVFDRAIAFQVLVDGVDEAHAEAAAVEGYSQSLPDTQRLNASCRLVEKNEVCQLAVKP